MNVGLSVLANTITNPTYYNIEMHNGKHFPVLQIGIDSFIGEAKVDCCIDILKDEDIVYDLQIGNYCSLSDEITLLSIWIMITIELQWVI